MFKNKIEKIFLLVPQGFLDSEKSAVSNRKDFRAQPNFYEFIDLILLKNLKFSKIFKNKIRIFFY